ncbi:MAG: aspartate-semialdehyde dehydrogenase [Acidobacteriota bacterium]
MTYRVAVLGATGLVGRKLLEILEQRDFPAREVVALASARSAGGVLPFRGEELIVQEAAAGAFDGIDLVLSSAGATVSRALLPEAAARGAVSVDNTSAFRMDAEVPLVVPEVNGAVLAERPPRGIIANPNCSTIQLVLALKPLHDAFGLKRVIASTYQSVSGAGAAAVDELRETSRQALAGEAPTGDVLPHPIAFNCLPQIDVFLEDGDTKEEWKMRVEAPKILGFDLPLHATCVRVPAFFAHSEAVWIETEQPIDPPSARQVLAQAPGVEVVDDPERLAYPTALDTAGSDWTRVGRIRRDPTVANGLALWIVADNLRVGAALNAVKIAERLAGC